MRSAALVCLAILAASPAVAGEAVATAGDGAPPPAAAVSGLPDTDPASADGPQAEGAQAARGDAPRRGCEQPPDRKPHGEVWAGIGTGGYRSVGGVVTQPIGRCGSVTVGVNYDRNRFFSGRP